MGILKKVYAVIKPSKLEMFVLITAIITTLLKAVIDNIEMFI